MRDPGTDHTDENRGHERREDLHRCASALSRWTLTPHRAPHSTFNPHVKKGGVEGSTENAHRVCKRSQSSWKRAPDDCLAVSGALRLFHPKCLQSCEVIIFFFFFNVSLSSLI